MTLLDVTFYAAPVLGLFLFLFGYHLGGSRRTKEHDACVAEVGRLYDELRWLRKELADFELERSQTQDQVGRLERENRRLKDGHLKLEEMVEFELCVSSSKSAALEKAEAETEEVKERLLLLSRQYNKLLRSHMKNGGTKIT